jgi:hypothetical protein
MKSLLYHGFGIKGYRYLRTRYEKGEIIFELEPENEPEVPAGRSSDGMGIDGVWCAACRSG